MKRFFIDYWKLVVKEALFFKEYWWQSILFTTILLVVWTFIANKITDYQIKKLNKSLDKGRKEIEETEKELKTYAAKERALALSGYSNQEVANVLNIKAAEEH